MRWRAVTGGFVLMLIALGASAGVTAASATTADVDDFRFSSFDATYTLSTDSDGRSVLDVVETLVAEFPEFDQNRGIRRDLVDTYDGHPTDLDVESVTDETGAPREFESESDDGFETLTIAGDEYVRGTQTYVITYRQHNVTRFFSDTGRDEFYWDTNGTGWSQSFDRVTATVVIAPDLRGTLTGDTTAVAGTAGATEPAQVEETGEGFRFIATEVGPGENLTFAIGFEPNTFVARDDSFFGEPWPSIATVGAIASLVSVVAALILRRRRLRDAPGRGIIIPEYLPPKGVSLLLSAVILRRPTKAMTAQILQLAVAGNIRVVEIEQKRAPGYRLDFLDSTGADADGLAFLHALFGAELTPGETRTLAKSDPKAMKRLSKLTTSVAARSITDGYRRRLPGSAIAVVVLAAAVSATLGFVFSVVALDRAVAGPIMVVILIVALIGLFASIALVSRRPLDPRGVELRDYLEGLRMYMTLAEADRMRVLQSPEGALRSPLAELPRDLSSGAGSAVGEHVLLNERLLPYAALFGLEKRWAEELALAYDQAGSHPSWYFGMGAFNPVLFANGIGSVSTAVSSSYSASSGGSGGGASSGGGGGGGGGGGV